MAILPQAATKRILITMSTSCDCCLLPNLGRRSMIAGGLAAVAVSGARAQTPAKPHRIDVHHHFAPPVVTQSEIRGD